MFQNFSKEQKINQCLKAKTLLMQGTNKCGERVVLIYLTREEERMLKGEMGPSRQWAMEYLVKYGDALEAEKLIKASSVGMGFNTDVRNMMPPEAYDDLLKRGFAVPNYSWALPEMECWHEAGHTLQQMKEQRELNQLCGKVGCYQDGSCAAYIAGWIPVFGTIAPTAESSQVPYVNSVFGARSNKEAGMGSLTRIAVAGRVPYCGLYTDEGRKGTMQVKVEVELEEEADWNAMGDWTGRLNRGRALGISGDVPVFTEIERLGDVRVEHLKGFGASLATTGDCGMYHLVGYTPEAHTPDMAFQGDKPPETATFGERELRDAYDQISTHGSDKVDCVVLGCPHYTIDQLTRLAKLLDGKKVRKDVKFWVLTPPHHRDIARLTGIYDTIRDSGAYLMSHCWMLMGSILPPWEPLPKQYVVATDSPKICNYAPKNWRDVVDVWFGTMKDCVNAAITGKWEPTRWRK